MVLAINLSNSGVKDTFISSLLTNRKSVALITFYFNTFQNSKECYSLLFFAIVIFNFLGYAWPGVGVCLAGRYSVVSPLAAMSALDFL